MTITDVKFLITKTEPNQFNCSVLINWKPDYEYKTSLNERGTLIVKNDDTYLRTKCLEIINIIKDKDAVYSLLNKLWNMVSFIIYLHISIVVTKKKYNRL